jgi:hypothetical protein
MESRRGAEGVGKGTGGASQVHTPLRVLYGALLPPAALRCTFTRTAPRGSNPDRGGKVTSRSRSRPLSPFGIRPQGQPNSLRSLAPTAHLATGADAQAQYGPCSLTLLRHYTGRVACRSSGTAQAALRGVTQALHRPRCVPLLRHCTGRVA